MASTDARLFPRKNEACRVTFAIFDADGDGVTGATGLDSEISKDGAAFADCTNEAAEIGQGFYYLDLTSAEMNADTVAVIVKTTSLDAKSTRLVFYPIESGDISGVELADGAITAAKVADNAIDAGAIATDAITEIQNGLATAAALATVDSVVDSIAGNVDVAVSTRLAAADYTAPDNAGIDTLEIRLSVDRAALLDNLPNLDAAVSSRLASASYTAPPSAAIVADSVWDEARASHVAAGSFGEGISSVQGNVTGSVGSVASFGTLVADIWAYSSRTLTDVSVTILNKIADRTIRRSYANAATSADGDAKTLRSILGVIARLTNRNAVGGSTLTIYEADDTTPLGTMTLTTNAAADPVVEQDPS